jgi:hypothetical protein
MRFGDGMKEFTADIASGSGRCSSVSGRLLTIECEGKLIADTYRKSLVIMFPLIS